jgi:peptidoglycan biosynthesis protein MviN/MurJ (putative lipid II flippase)
MALIASDRQKRWVVVGGLAALTNPLFNLAAIPFAVRTYENGAIGAAVITVVTELLMIAGALYLRPPGVLDRATAMFVLRCAVAAALMVPAVVVTSSIPRLETHVGSGVMKALVGLIAEIAVGVVVYVVASIALRTISIDEVRRYAPRVLAALPLRRTKQSTNSE